MLKRHTMRSIAALVLSPNYFDRKNRCAPNFQSAVCRNGVQILECGNNPALTVELPALRRSSKQPEFVCYAVTAALNAMRSVALKNAVPATRVSTPREVQAFAVRRSMPPSTCRR